MLNATETIKHVNPSMHEFLPILELNNDFDNSKIMILII